MSDLHTAYVDDPDDVVAVDDFSIDDALSTPIPVAKGQKIYGMRKALSDWNALPAKDRRLEDDDDNSRMASLKVEVERWIIMGNQEYYVSRLKAAISAKDTALMQAVMLKGSECGEELGQEWDKLMKTATAMKLEEASEMRKLMSRGPSMRMGSQMPSHGSHGSLSPRASFRKAPLSPQTMLSLKGVTDGPVSPGGPLSPGGGMLSPLSRIASKGAFFGGDSKSSSRGAHSRIQNSSASLLTIADQFLPHDQKIRFDWRKYPNLRPPADFSKNHLFDKSKLEKSMLRWVKEDLPRSLFKFESRQQITLKNGTTAAASEHSMDLFKVLQTAMGDAAKAAPMNVNVFYIVENGFNVPAIRDEIYLQIMKQCTDNPNIESTIRGWKVLKASMICFPPSAAFKHYLWSFCYHHSIAMDDTAPKKTIFDTVRRKSQENVDFFKVLRHSVIAETAKESLALYEQHLYLAEEKAPPTLEKVTAICKDVTLEAPVWLTDATVTVVGIPPKDSLLNASDLLDMIIPMLELTEEEGSYYGLFETTAVVVKNVFLSERSECRRLNSDDVVLDIISGWANKPSPPIGQQYIILFKKIIFPMDEMYSPTVSTLFQGQLVGSLAAGDYDITPIEAVYLIALQIQLTFGGNLKFAISNFGGDLYAFLRRFLPLKFVEKETTEWWAAVLSQGLEMVKEAIPDNDPYKLELEYIKTIKSLPDFGKLFFSVTKSDCDSSVVIPGVAFLGLREDRIAFLNSDKEVVGEPIKLFQVESCTPLNEHTIELVYVEKQQTRTVFWDCVRADEFVNCMFSYGTAALGSDAKADEDEPPPPPPPADDGPDLPPPPLPTTTKLFRRVSAVPPPPKRLSSSFGFTRKKSVDTTLPPPNVPTAVAEDPEAPVKGEGAPEVFSFGAGSMGKRGSSGRANFGGNMFREKKRSLLEEASEPPAAPSSTPPLEGEGSRVSSFGGSMNRNKKGLSVLEDSAPPPPPAPVDDGAPPAPPMPTEDVEAIISLLRSQLVAAENLAAQNQAVISSLTDENVKLKEELLQAQKAFDSKDREAVVAKEGADAMQASVEEANKAVLDTIRKLEQQQESNSSIKEELRLSREESAKLVEDHRKAAEVSVFKDEQLVALHQEIASANHKIHGLNLLVESKESTVMEMKCALPLTSRQGVDALEADIRRKDEEIKKRDEEIARLKKLSDMFYDRKNASPGTTEGGSEEDRDLDSPLLENRRGINDGFCQIL